MSRLRTHNRKRHRRQFPNYSPDKHGWTWYLWRALNIHFKQFNP